MYTENQIFKKIYPPEAAHWCMRNGHYITEIEPVDGQRCFQIKKCPGPTPEQAAQVRIAELQAYLKDTDWYAIREAETGSEANPIPDDIKAARQAAREEISRLRDNP